MLNQTTIFSFHKPSILMGTFALSDHNRFYTCKSISCEIEDFKNIMEVDAIRKQTCCASA